MGDSRRRRPADPGIPSLLRITAAELRKRLEIGPEFNLLKFHTVSPKLSFLAYPDFEKCPHPSLAEAAGVWQGIDVGTQEQVGGVAGRTG